MAGTPLDFTQQAPIGARIGQLLGTACRGYDHNFALHGLGPGAAARTAASGRCCEEAQLAARVLEPRSGRWLEVLTTAPGVQLYTGNWLAGVKGKEGAVYERNAGFCLETQCWPDAVNHPGVFPSPVLRPGVEYQHVMIIRLGGGL